MRHPGLPAVQVIEVEERLVPGHRASGWVVTDPPPKPQPEPEAEPETAPGAGGDVPVASVEEKTEQPAPEKPSRRRTPKEDEK